MDSTSYEDIPYESRPQYPTHPDVLGTLGRLFGLNPAPASRCRVLELGCATGMNVICLGEALPESQFVGIDLSPSQIEAGQRLVARAGLNNVQLHAASILDLDESWGKFDYIIAHGVFSWIPTAVQDKIFSLYRQLLHPHGIGYISYNTYPGWHLRHIARDLMQYASQDLPDPQQKIQQSRAVLQFMATSAPKQDTPHAVTLGTESELLSQAPDSYLFHEHLEEVNAPLYFHQFAARAQRHQLQYLSEAWQHNLIDELPADVAESLRGISGDLIQLEQYGDFLFNRTFRRTLLCHREAPVDRAPGDQLLASLYVSALAEPATPTPNVRSTEPISFKLDHGASISVNFPIVKAAFTRLYQVFPRALPFGDLFELALSDVADPAADPQQQRAILLSILLRGHLAHFVALHREPFALTASVSERPEVNVLARLLASQSKLVPTRRHKLVPVQAAERALLPLVNGKRDRAAIVNDLQAARQAGEFPDDATAELPSQREALAIWIDTALQRWARQGLLVG
jgi:cyclopropane fatty-acyl-phospholipid synthase-like methyltransferase